MENIIPHLPFIIGLTFFISTGVLSIILIGKNDRIKQYRASLAAMKKSFEELDEQAKLIVKTDLELNKAQEESDRRLGSLDALHKISRLISTTLAEDEILQRLNQILMTDLGFEKNLILILDEGNKFHPRVSLGFSPEGLQFILANLEKDTNLITALKEGHTFSSTNAPFQRRESIVRIFDVEHFVISPILTQNGIVGAIFVGNQSNTSAITVGDEELVSILANQIGQALENARLFEQVYQGRQILESKVQDRTRQLASALKEVQNISKTKSEFISAVSHELRTPLTSIKGYASILIDGKLGEIPDQVKERLKKINIHSDNLVNLINDLLDISRIESGRVEMNIGKCDVLSLIDNVQDLLTPQIKDKNIELKLEIPEKIPEMNLDRSHVERVFINLISNAIKFTPEKGTITIKVKHDGKQATFEVSDTGIGIAKDDIARLFDEFYRVENEINQNVKGTGLGLPLAKKIVEAHDGTMWITSKLKEGTTFHFSIPFEKSEPTKKEKTKS